jgi:hypothetical protein
MTTATINVGISLAARVRDMTMIETAIETRLENMEVLVGLWDEVATSEPAICELEKLTDLTRGRIKIWRAILNNDRRRNKFASDLLLAFYASYLGLTRCQARAELHSRPFASSP